MDMSWLCILSLVWSMERRMLFSLGLASSAISSSERMQRWISVDSPVRGVSSSKYSSRVSVGVPPSAGPPPLGLGLSLSRASPLVVLSFPALP